MKKHPELRGTDRFAALRVLLVALCLVLAGCGAVVERDGPGSRPVSSTTPDAVPRAEPRSKYGNPDSYVVFGKRYHTLETANGFRERGVASWYGKKFHGRKTSSGEVYDMYQMTAAHKHLPLPTYVQVKNLDNGRSAVVKVNDRGPFHDNRIIDLSYAAALKLGIVDRGTGFVEVVALDAKGRPSGQVMTASTAPAAQAGPPPNGVYLQVGAFSDRSNANRLHAQLESVVQDAVHVREVSAGGRTVHRVQIGPIASVATADAIVATLRHLGIDDHHFVAF